MTAFDGWDDFRGKVELLRPQPGDILVLTGVELPVDPKTGKVDEVIHRRIRAYFGLEVKVATFTHPDVEVRLERDAE